jgi:hypothetical protein
VAEHLTGTGSMDHSGAQNVMRASTSASDWSHWPKSLERATVPARSRVMPSS